MATPWKGGIIIHLICVDDEQLALDNFRLTVKDLPGVESLHLFQTGQEALDWAKSHEVTVAFLDMEMPTIHGLHLAKALHALNANISVVFVTAFSHFALEAFAVDAVGYIMKPYTREDVLKELHKAARLMPITEHKISITTIPFFSIHIDGVELRISNNKCKEMLAFFVDRNGVAASAGDIIACLWPDRPNDEATGTLLRVTYNRLLHLLTDAGIGHILDSQNRQRWLIKEHVDCDLYRILAGDKKAGKSYAGEYLREYSWSEATNARLARLLNYVEHY